MWEQWLTKKFRKFFRYFSLNSYRITPSSMFIHSKLKSVCVCHNNEFTFFPILFRSREKAEYQIVLSTKVAAPSRLVTLVRSTEVLSCYIQAKEFDSEEATKTNQHWWAVSLLHKVREKMTGRRYAGQLCKRLLSTIELRCHRHAAVSTCIVSLSNDSQMSHEAIQ